MIKTFNFVLFYENICFVYFVLYAKINWQLDFYAGGLEVKQTGIKYKGNQLSSIVSNNKGEVCTFTAGN